MNEALGSKTLRLGVIGLGAMGRHHARIYSTLPHVDLVGLADIDETATMSLAGAYGTRGFLRYQQLLDQGLDAVSIAVPTSLHREACLAAARAGVNVLVEKPIADSVDSAREMIAVCRQAGVRLMVGHVERFNPVTAVVKRAMADCDVISLTISRLGPFPPRIKDVGVILDLAIHDIDLARYLTGAEVTKAYSLFSKIDSDERENGALLSFEMSNGVLAQLTTNWLTPFKVREISVAAREKFIRGWLQEQKVSEYRHWREDGSYNVKELAVPFGEPLRLELEAFVESLRCGAEVPTPGEEGLKALAVALQCLDAGRGR